MISLELLNLKDLNIQQISELIKEHPKCPYFYENHCEWASARLSRMVPLSKAFCNLTCKKSGPYSGNEFTLEKEKKFLEYIWEKANPTGGIVFAVKVLKHHYMTPVDISIPDNYNILKEKLSFLNSIKGFLGFYLTGSIIISTAEKPPKDYDIVLKFDSIKSILEANLNNILPKDIDGIKTDYFYYIGENPDVYFACLDVENKILYTSPWFDLKINKISPDIQIKKIDSKFKEILKNIVDKSDK